MRGIRGLSARKNPGLAGLARLAVLLALGGQAGCAGPDRMDAVPEALTERASVLGIANERFWPDRDGEALAQEAARALRRERDSLASGAALGTANYLAISGGADDGAFGAGLLVGWGDSGTRPSFKIVTGVSTGSLIAPFVFLGRAYDPQLREVYTNIKPDDIFEQRWLPTVIFRDALADTRPLYRLISRYADDNLLQAVAREYRRGRLLMIGTTDLDVQRPVVWNMGAIAASGKPGALELFRKVLLASASVPGIFPPVLIESHIGRRTYQELHVDGGVVVQTFLIPPQVEAIVRRGGAVPQRERRVFIIRNSRLDPDWSDVNPKLLSITERSISSMIHYSGYNDVLRIYSTAQRDGIDCNLAYIGRDFTKEKGDPFAQAYMRALFDYGYTLGRGGYPWHKAPPFMTGADGEEDDKHPSGASVSENRFVN